MRWFRRAVETVLLPVKARRHERGGDQVTRRIATSFQVRANVPVHVWITERIQAETNQPLLRFRQIRKGSSMRAGLLSEF